MSALLAFNRVDLVRGGRLLFQAMDLVVDGGDGLLITGPNGVGKSSLIRLAAGLLRASRGTVARSTVALADDRLALDRELPLGRALRFWTPSDPHPALDALGIAALAPVPVRLLSSGQAKRAALARVVASGAPLWLLDEPVNALDGDGVDRLARAVDRHRSAGGAVVATSHVSLPGEWRRLDLGR